MVSDFRAHMSGGNKRKINNQPVIEAVLRDPTRVSELFECVKDEMEVLGNFALRDEALRAYLIPRRAFPNSEKAVCRRVSK